MHNLAFININLGTTEVVTAFLIFGWSPILLIAYCLIDILRSRFRGKIIKLTWLSLVLGVPVIGAVLYMVAGKSQKVPSKLMHPADFERIAA